MTDNTNAPAFPADYFTSKQARETHFAETVKAVEQAVPVQVQPNAEDSAFLSEVMQAKGPDGKLLYFSNAKVRASIEDWRQKVYAGERIPPEVIAVTRADMEGKPRPEVAAPVDTSQHLQGSPLERAQAVLESDGGYIDSEYWSNVPAEVRSQITCGYSIDVPGDYVLTGDDVAQLRAARAAGVSQAQIDRFVAELRKQP